MVLSDLGYNEWFMLDLVCQNVHPGIFQTLMTRLYHEKIQATRDNIKTHDMVENKDPEKQDTIAALKAEFERFERLTSSPTTSPKTARKKWQQGGWDATRKKGDALTTRHRQFLQRFFLDRCSTHHLPTWPNTCYSKIGTIPLSS